MKDRGLDQPKYNGEQGSLVDTAWKILRRPRSKTPLLDSLFASWDREIKKNPLGRQMEPDEMQLTELTEAELDAQLAGARRWMRGITAGIWDKKQI